MTKSILCGGIAVILLSVAIAGTSSTGDVEVADTQTQQQQQQQQNMQQYMATTTAKPSKHGVDEDGEDAAPNSHDSTLDDFEDTLPDEGPPDASPMEQLFSEAGLRKALAIFETVSSVWQNVTAERGEAMASAAQDESANGLTTTAHPTTSSSSSASEARYIKGDPLKGYYDFIIKEGSYKFWAVFQLFTAGLMIYSTFAAIYYSKVNPIVSDYDYVNYLGGRSLGAASSARSASSDATDGDGAHPLGSLLNAGWMQNAAHGFEFIMDAIDRIPAK